MSGNHIAPVCSHHDAIAASMTSNKIGAIAVNADHVVSSIAITALN
jgi:hypothetical protein